MKAKEITVKSELYDVANRKIIIYTEQSAVQSRLTQVLDEQSSTGKALKAIYDDLGIALFDSGGQLRSTYDILFDLSKQWESLSTNQKDYIALTQAGRLMPL